MRIQKPVVDYRKLTKHNIMTPPYRHVLWLIVWPISLLVFGLLERGVSMDHYTPIHCALDDVIPFCEWFVIPYMLWFFYMFAIVVYTFFYDVDRFVWIMKFIAVTYTVTYVIYILFPTCQQLRPAVFERDNVLTHFVALFYTFDTNTNVCPSIHVLGTLAVFGGAYRAKGLTSAGIRILSGIIALSICLSTVFMKQHSVIDVFAALPITLFAVLVCRVGSRKKEDRTPAPAQEEDMMKV